MAAVRAWKDQICTRRPDKGIPARSRRPALCIRERVDVVGSPQREADEVVARCASRLPVAVDALGLDLDDSNTSTCSPRSIWARSGPATIIEEGRVAGLLVFGGVVLVSTLA